MCLIFSDQKHWCKGSEAQHWAMGFPNTSVSYCSIFALDLIFLNVYVQSKNGKFVTVSKQRANWDQKLFGCESLWGKSVATCARVDRILSSSYRHGRRCGVEVRTPQEVTVAYRRINLWKIQKILKQIQVNFFPS